MDNPFAEPAQQQTQEEGDLGSWCQSAQVDQLFAALVAFQSEAPNVIKKAKADLGKGGAWTYAPLSVVRHIMRPVLAKHGIGILQLPHQRYDANTNSYRVGVSTRLIHSSGQWLQSPPMWCVPVDFSGTPSLRAIHFGSALTYARRYSYEATLGIVASKDDDGVAGSGLSRSSEDKPPVAESGRSLTCSQCGKPMVLRRGTKGEFYGCAGYPDCKNTLSATEAAPVTTSAASPTGNSQPADAQPPDNVEKEKRRAAWQVVKKIGETHHWNDLELSIFVEALGRKAAGVPVDEIEAIGQLIPEVAKQYNEFKRLDHIGKSSAPLPANKKHFLQLSRSERDQTIASAEKTAVPF